MVSISIVVVVGRSVGVPSRLCQCGLIMTSVALPSKTTRSRARVVPFFSPGQFMTKCSRNYAHFVGLIGGGGEGGRGDTKTKQ